MAKTTATTTATTATATGATHRAVEVRMTAGQAATLAAYLPRFRRLVESGVMTVPPADRDDVLGAVDLLLSRLGEGQPAFEEALPAGA
jgi:hypothetical protein